MTDTLWRNIDEILENSFHQSIVFTHIPSPNITPLKLWENMLFSAHKIGIRHLLVDGRALYGKSLDYALLPAVDLGWEILSFEADPRLYFASYKSFKVENLSVSQAWESARKLDGFPSRFFIQWFEEVNAINLVKLVASFANTPLLIGCAESHTEVTKDDFGFGKSLGWHFSQMTGINPYIIGQNVINSAKTRKNADLSLWQPLLNLGGTGGYFQREVGDRFKQLNKLNDAELWLIEHSTI